MNMMNAADMRREEGRGTVKGDLPERPLYFDSNLQIVFIISLIVVMGVSSISPALPEIQAAFGIQKPAVGLLIMGLVHLIGGFETIFFLSAGLAAAMIPVASMIVR
jgi:hypothetical protein